MPLNNVADDVSKRADPEPTTTTSVTSTTRFGPTTTHINDPLAVYERCIQGAREYADEQGFTQDERLEHELISCGAGPQP